MLYKRIFMHERIFMLTPRLIMIVQNVSADTVADIGTDHAFVPIELARRGKKVIATDANKGPLVSAKRNISNHGLDIELRLGGGLSPLSAGEAEEIIIAGMGGELIKNIISDDIDKAFPSRLILQPMNSQSELRQFLIESGFGIVREDLAKEGRRVYNLIIAERGASSLPSSEIDLHLPPVLYDHPLFPMLLEKKKREFLKQYQGLSEASSESSGQLARLHALLSDIENIKKDVVI